MKLGILAIQGSVEEHFQMGINCGFDPKLIKTATDLSQIDYLIIPGGESTTMRKLLEYLGMWEILEKRVKEGSINIFGTCAGAILCQYWGMPIEVTRNAYGGQLESFEASLESKKWKNLKGVFIRAPRLTPQSNEVETLAFYQKDPVILSWKNLLVASFHPELLKEERIYRYFLNA